MFSVTVTLSRPNHGVSAIVLCQHNKLLATSHKNPDIIGLCTGCWRSLYWVYKIKQQ